MQTRDGSSVCACVWRPLVMADKTAARPGPPGLRRILTTGVLAGGFAALGQAPVSLPFVTLIALAVVFLTFRTLAPRPAAWLGWATGAGYFALSLSWMVEPFLVDIARHGWMAPFALFIASTGFGLFWAAGFWLAAWGTRPGWPREVGWAVALTLAEVLRSYLLTGFPWALIGHVWIGWAPMQLAALVGAHGLTVLTLLIVVLGAQLRGWAGRSVLIAACAALYVGAWWHGAQPVPDADRTDRPVLRLVQPNAAQHLKWDPDMAPVFFQRALDLTAAPPDGPKPGLIIWPETAVPYLLNRSEAALERIAAAAAGVPVVTGIQRLDGYRAYNSLVVIGADGEVVQLYDKAHLVPFGEYLPGGDFLAKFGISAFSAQEGNGYSAGPGLRVLDLGPSFGDAVPLICYEAVFPNDIRPAASGADWMMQLTNDAWFGRISGPYQHLAQARLRAVEFGLPFVRAANTGVSAVIDARGHVTARLDLGVAGVLDAALPAALPATIYARTGDLPLIALLLIVFCALLSAFTGARRDGNGIDDTRPGA